MATPNRDPRVLVDEAMQRLLDVLGPFVRDALESAYGPSWWAQAVEPVLATRAVDPGTVRDQSVDSLDLRELLAVIERSWRTAFEGRLARPARSYIGECRFYRDQCAHFRKALPWTGAEALRAIDTMRRLARLCAPTRADAQSAIQALDALLGEINSPTGPVEPDAVPPEPAGPDTAVISVREFPLRSLHGFVEAHGLDAEASRIKNLPVPKGVQGSPYRRALFAELLEEHNLLDRFIKERWPHGGTEDGQRRLKSHRRLLDRLRSAPEGEANDGWSTIAHLSGSVEGPEDLATEHEHYLYGVPKKDTAAGS